MPIDTASSTLLMSSLHYIKSFLLRFDILCCFLFVCVCPRPTSFFFFLMSRHPPRSTLFPNTTLSRSQARRPAGKSRLHLAPPRLAPPRAARHVGVHPRPRLRPGLVREERRRLPRARGGARGADRA